VWTGDGRKDGLSQLLAKRAIQFGMGLNGGPQDDFAARFELAILLLCARLEVGKFGPGLLVPFEQLGDPLMDCSALLAHECLPLG
jgi:hypothetical protein